MGFWAGKGANIRDLFRIAAKVLKLHESYFGNYVAPRLSETGTPRIPAQRSRRSLLEYGTAQHRTTSILLLHEYEYKVSDITMNNIGTTTLRLRYYTCSMLATKQLLAAEIF